MEPKSIRELFKIVAMEGVDRSSGRTARESALKDWVSDWIVEVETSQSVIKTNLTSEEEDFLKYWLAYTIGDKLMEDCIDVQSEKTKITTKILALRR